MGWVGKVKPNGESQTTRNTVKNVILGNNLEITYFFFQWVIGIYTFLGSRGKESLKLNILLNRAFFTVIKQEDFEGSVFQFLYRVAAQAGVCQ